MALSFFSRARSFFLCFAGGDYGRVDGGVRGDREGGGGGCGGVDGYDGNGGDRGDRGGKDCCEGGALVGGELGFGTVFFFGRVWGRVKISGATPVSFALERVTTPMKSENKKKEDNKV